MTGTERAGNRRRGGALIKVLAAGLTLATVGGGGVWGVRAWRGHGAEGPTGADIATVSRTTFEISTTAAGELQAKKEIELRSELDSQSTIAELAPEGSFVHAGELLVKLSNDQLQTSLDEEELRVASAKADLVAADKGYEIQQSDNDSKIREAKLKLDLAELSLNQWREGEKVQKLQDIALDLDKTEKELKRLQEKVANSHKLFDKGFLSKDEMDQDDIALRDAQAAREKAILAETTYKNYQMVHDERQKTSDVEEARAELDRVTAQAAIQLAIKDADRTNKRRTLQLNQDKLEKLQKQIASMTIKAPQDGLVVYATSAGKNWFDDSPFTVGRQVRPQEPLIVLPDTSVMMAAVRVAESLAGKIKPGQPATVKIDAAGGKVFTGKVDSIGVMADVQGRWMDPNRREYTVKIALDPGDAGVQLKPSMRCEATITLGRVDDVVAVPVQAVFSDEAVRFVYVPRSGKYVRVPVKVGRRSETLAEIDGGLRGGERVLLRDPGAGEVVREPWNAAALKLAGFELSKEGKAIAIAEPKAPGKPGGKVETGTQTASAAPVKTEDGAAKPAEGADAKPAEPKPGETRAADAKPAEAKPGESKPGETKLADAKDAKADPKAEVKPVETKTGTAAEVSETRPAGG